MWRNLSTYLRTTLRRTRRDRCAGRRSVKHRRPKLEAARVRTFQPEQVNSLCASRRPGIGCRKTVNQLRVRRDEQSPPPLCGTHIVRTSTAVSIISRNSPRVTDMAGASMVVNVRLPATPATGISLEDGNASRHASSSKSKAHQVSKPTRWPHRRARPGTARR